MPTRGIHRGRVAVAHRLLKREHAPRRGAGQPPAHFVVAPSVHEFARRIDGDNVAGHRVAVGVLPDLPRAYAVERPVRHDRRPASQPVGVGEPRPHLLGWVLEVAH